MKFLLSYMIIKIETKYKVDTYFLSFDEKQNEWKLPHSLIISKNANIDIIIPTYSISYRLKKKYYTIRSIKYDHSSGKLSIST